MKKIFFKLTFLVFGFGSCYFAAAQTVDASRRTPPTSELAVVTSSDQRAENFLSRLIERLTRDADPI